MAVDVLIDPVQQPELHQKALRASGVVRDALGSSADLVQAEWYALTEPEAHGSRSAAGLRLTDPFAGTIETKFAPSELDSDSRVWGQVSRALGELLQRRSHAHLERLDELVKDLGKD